MVEDHAFFSLQVNNQLLNTLSVECKSCSHAHQLSSYNDLPKKIMGDLNQCSSVKSMDFHPLQQTLLFGKLLLLIASVSVSWGFCS